MNYSNTEFLLDLISLAIRLFVTASVLWFASWYSDLHVRFLSCLVVAGLILSFLYGFKTWMVRQLNVVVKVAQETKNPQR